MVNDYYEFKKFHQNFYNRLIHIFSFLVGFIAFCFIFPKNIRYILIILYVVIILIIYKNLALILKIIIIIITIYIIFYYLNITSKITLLIIILITYMLPELSHIYFNEKTYLYNRLYRETSIFNAIIQLLKHMINLVPYCFV
jgi:hypothetical protein